MSYQTITTRYVAQTNTKPHRIIATNGHGTRVIISRDETETLEQAHALAVTRLCAKLDWDDVAFIGGLVDDGDTYVWVNAKATDRVAIPKLPRCKHGKRVTLTCAACNRFVAEQP